MIFKKCLSIKTENKNVSWALSISCINEYSINKNELVEIKKLRVGGKFSPKSSFKTGADLGGRADAPPPPPPLRDSTPCRPKGSPFDTV